MILDLFPDLATKLICSADGDPVEPPAGGDAGGAAVGTPPPAEPAASAPAEPEPYTPDWRDRELDQKHRQIKDQQQQIEQLRAEQEQLKRLAEAAARGEAAPLPRPSAPPPSYASADSEIERLAQQRAAEIVATDQTAALDAALKANHSKEEYEAIVRNFANLDGAFKILFADIMATDEGPYVTAVLGRNPAEIQRIRDLPTARRQNALMRIALEKPKPGAAPAPAPATRPSGAPPPPSANPPGGTVMPVESANLYDERYDFKNYYAGNDHLNVEKDRDASWYARRAEEKRNSVGRIWSLGNRAGMGGKV